MYNAPHLGQILKQGVWKGDFIYFLGSQINSKFDLESICRESNSLIFLLILYQTAAEPRQVGFSPAVTCRDTRGQLTPALAGQSLWPFHWKLLQWAVKGSVSRRNKKCKIIMFANTPHILPILNMTEWNSYDAKIKFGLKVNWLWPVRHTEITYSCPRKCFCCEVRRVQSLSFNIWT